MDERTAFRILTEKEKITNKLTNLNARQLTKFVQHRRKLLALAVGVSYLGDAVLGGSLIGSTLGVITRNEDLFFRFLATGATGTTIAYTGDWASQKVRKSIDMAENETLVRGLKAQPIKSTHSSD